MSSITGIIRFLEKTIGEAGPDADPEDVAKLEMTLQGIRDAAEEYGKDEIRQQAEAAGVIPKVHVTEPVPERERTGRTPDDRPESERRLHDSGVTHIHPNAQHGYELGRDETGPRIVRADPIARIEQAVEALAKDHLRLAEKMALDQTLDGLRKQLARMEERQEQILAILAGSGIQEAAVQRLAGQTLAAYDAVKRASGEEPDFAGLYRMADFSGV